VQDELEQYGRRECHTNAIVIKLAASKIGVQVKEEDISVSRRLANPQSNNTASSGNYIVSYAACSRVRGFLPTYRLLTAATHSIPIV
jgi:hypothetical protein